MLDAQCGAAVKLVNFGLEKMRRCDGLETDMGPFLSFLQESLLVGLKDMKTKQLLQVLKTEIGM